MPIEAPGKPRSETTTDIFVCKTHGVHSAVLHLIYEDETDGFICLKCLADAFPMRKLVQPFNIPTLNEMAKQ